MKKIICSLCLIVIMQNAFTKESWQTKYINHTLNIVTSWLPTTTYVLANIGDSVSLYVYWDYALTGCTEWYYFPSLPTSIWDTIPESYMANPLSFVVTQHGYYTTFSGAGNQFILIPAVYPVQPGVITGRKKGVCTVTQFYNEYYYSVPYVTGNTYNWTLPAGLSLLGGWGTNTIRVRNYGDNYISGQITVTANNALGTSPARTLTITSGPATPIAITGPATVCSGSSGNAYSISSVYSAISYKWVGPSGCHISDGTTTSTSNLLTTTSTSVTVSYGTVTPASVLKVKVNNNCGFSDFRKLTLIPCGPREESASAYAEPGHIDFLGVFPSPVQTSVTVNFKLTKPCDVEISLLDLNGKQLKNDLYKNVSGEFIKNENTEALSKGIYFVRIKAGNETVQKKFVKM